MSVKAILVLCAQALLVKSALSQACGYASPIRTRPCGLAAAELIVPWASFGATGLAGPYGLAGRGLGYDAIIGAPTMEISPTSGGGMPVISRSAVAPVGISVASDNFTKVLWK
ncbi:hypothetical protein HF086_014178 [Spodoptera exigua]|uniref:Uncharacterized protein n=1 Tax=Spodoptera exigua TaxID=7107 RepID=A0A922N0F0_SPOEX|nr:hypothetical protein HF086_014178 [Spodoptera exigua]